MSLLVQSSGLANLQLWSVCQSRTRTLPQSYKTTDIQIPLPEVLHSPPDISIMSFANSNLFSFCALFFLSLHLYPAAVPCSQGNEADPRIKARETGGSSVALSGLFHGWRGFCTAVLGRYTNLRGLFCFFLRVELDRVPDLSWEHAGAGGLDKAGRWR
jgi:hypothetical protein